MFETNGVGYARRRAGGVYIVVPPPPRTLPKLRRASLVPSVQDACNKHKHKSRRVDDPGQSHPVAAVDASRVFDTFLTVRLQQERALTSY